MDRVDLTSTKIVKDPWIGRERLGPQKGHGRIHTVKHPEKNGANHVGYWRGLPGYLRALRNGAELGGNCPYEAPARRPRRSANQMTAFTGDGSKICPALST